MDMRAGIAPSRFRYPVEPPGAKAWQDGAGGPSGRAWVPLLRAAPAARSAMLGEGKEKRRTGIRLRLGDPLATRA